MKTLSFKWSRDSRNGAHVCKVGKFTMQVWYDALRSRDDDGPAYGVSVFGHRPDRNQPSIEAGKAWCEKWGKRLLAEMVNDVGATVPPELKG